MASLSSTSSRIRLTDGLNEVSFSQTFSREDPNTTMTVTLSGYEGTKDNMEELIASYLADKVSAVSSAAMSSSSHVSSLCSRDRIDSERQEGCANSGLVKPSLWDSTAESSIHSIDQDECQTSDIEETIKQIPEGLNAENFEGCAKIAVHKYNNKRVAFFEMANGTIEYIDDATPDNIAKINAFADELIRLGAFLKVIEQVPGEVEIDVGLAKIAVEEYHRKRTALIEGANVKLRDENNINITRKDIKEIIDSVEKLRDYQIAVFKIKKRQSSLSKKAFSRSARHPTQAKVVKGLEIAEVNAQIKDRRNAITPETDFFKLAEVEREKLNKISQST